LTRFATTGNPQPIDVRHAGRFFQVSKLTSNTEEEYHNYSLVSEHLKTIYKAAYKLLQYGEASRNLLDYCLDHFHT
jgi:hypothetical protein